MTRRSGPVGGVATAGAAAALGAVGPTGAVSVPGGGVSVAPAAPVATPPSGGAGGARTRRRAAGAAARRGPVSTSTAPVTRPNGSLYYPRTLGDMTDVDALRIARGAKIPFGLYGPPGTGKTALVEAAFVATGFEMLLCTGDTTTDDLIGQWIPDGHGGYTYVRGPLLRSLDRDVPLYVDEMCLPDPRVLAPVYPLLDGRGWIAVTTDKGTEVLTAGEGWGFGGSWNPDVPGANLSEALLSRIPLKVEVRSDYALARSLGVAETAVLAAENLATKWDNDEVSWAPQLRELLDFARIEAEFGTDVAWSNLITAAPEADRETAASTIQIAATMGRAPEPLRLGAQA